MMKMYIKIINIFKLNIFAKFKYFKFIKSKKNLKRNIMKNIKILMNLGIKNYFHKNIKLNK